MIVVTVKHKQIMSEDDGPRKWVIVVAAFFTQLIICGITYSIGIFHVVFRDHFQQNHFDISWVGSILLYVTALSSVMLRFVTSEWGCRVSVMLGGLIAAGGLSLGMFVTQLYQVYICFGFITGVGFGLACTPSIVAVERHFAQNRFQALSVVVGGVGSGIVVFPIVIRFLIDEYAWRGTLLVLAGLCLNLCVCGALMRPQRRDKEIRLLPLFSCLPLRHPLFHGMCIANLFWSFGSTVIYLYLPSYAMAKGSDFETVTYLVTSIGVSGFTCRMMFAFMGRNSTLDKITSVLCPLGLGIVITGICPLMFNDIPGQVGYTILFGFYSGYWTTFLSQASRELLGPEYIALGNGYLCFMIAIGSLAGGPAAGMLIQEEMEFKYAFYLAGACLLWSSVIMVLFKIRSCVVPGRAAHNQINQPTEHKLPLITSNSLKVADNVCSDDIVVETMVTSF